MSKKSNRFSPEVRERTVRMAQEQCGEYASLWAAIESISPKIDCVLQTLHEWATCKEHQQKQPKILSPYFRSSNQFRRRNNNILFTSE